MKDKNFIRTKARANSIFFALVLVFIACFSGETFSQKTENTTLPANLPKVTQIDEIALKNLLKPNGKPLLVNFWATWCDPCREEFPDLVKIDADYRGKIDFIVISLDELEELNRNVPKFLSEVKAEMPAFLLKAKSDDEAISSVSKDWRGALPFTILFNEKGEIAYFKENRIKPEILRGEIDKVLNVKKPNETIVLMDFVKIKNGKRDEALYFYENNWKVYREIALKKGFIQSYELVEVAPNENNQFDLILITRYSSEEQYKNSEKNFEAIIKETRPNGAILKNELKPDDFRQNVFTNIGKPLFKP